MSWKESEPILSLEALRVISKLEPKESGVEPIITLKDSVIKNAYKWRSKNDFDVIYWWVGGAAVLGAVVWLCGMAGGGGRGAVGHMSNTDRQIRLQRHATAAEMDALVLPPISS